MKKDDKERNLHFVAVTGIIHKNNKFLIVKRSPKERNSPSKYTVPGGRLNADDYGTMPSSTKHSNQWYNVIQNVLKREIKEETNLNVKNVRYLTDLVFFRDTGEPTLVISMYCEYKSGKLKLSDPDELVDYVWVTAKEAKKYNLIDGILEELEVVDAILKNKKVPKNIVTKV